MSQLHTADPYGVRTPVKGRLARQDGGPVSLSTVTEGASLDHAPVMLYNHFTKGACLDPQSLFSPETSQTACAFRLIFKDGRRLRH